MSKCSDSLIKQLQDPAWSQEIQLYHVGSRDAVPSGTSTADSGLFLQEIGVRSQSEAYIQALCYGVWMS